MNNSLISELMLTNKNWRQVIQDKAIKIKEDENYVIFNYSIGADFFDKIVQEARGIILDKSDATVACVSFRKFGNIQEPYVDEIDWSSARVQDKMDGSIVRTYWNKYTNQWQWATNSVINAKNAECSSLLTDNFLTLIKKAKNYKEIPFEKLDKTKTYTFELIGPENAVVVKYNEPYLYHIGTRSNLTLEETNENIGIIKPKEYPLHSLEACLKAAQELNDGSDIDHEGYVVVDANWNRAKIKSPRYVAVHAYANGLQSFSKTRLLELLNDDDVNFDEIVKTFPLWGKVFGHYKEEIIRVEKEAQEAIDYYRNRYEELNHDRKALAQEVLKTKYDSIIFKAIGNNKTAKLLLSELSQGKYESLIEDYKEEL